MQVTRKEFYIGLAVVAGLLIAGVLAGKSYFDAQIAAARNNQVQQDMAPVHVEAQQVKDSAVKAEAGNQQTLTAALNALAAQQRQPVSTPVDYARIEQMIAARMGTTGKVTADPKLPDAPSATVDATKLRNYMLDCDGKQAQVESCRTTVDNTTTMLQAEQRDHDATKKELTAARAAVKGGFWHRMGAGARHSLCGGLAGGAGVGVAAKGKASATVALGIGAGAFVGCELLAK